MEINMLTADQLKYLNWAETQPALAPTLEAYRASYRRQTNRQLLKSEAWTIINTLKMKVLV